MTGRRGQATTEPDLQGASTERERIVHVVRNLLLLIVVLVIVAFGVALATNSWPVSTSSGGPSATSMAVGSDQTGSDAGGSDGENVDGTTDGTTDGTGAVDARGARTGNRPGRGDGSAAGSADEGGSVDDGSSGAATARLVAGPVRRILDTRDGAGVARGAGVDLIDPSTIGDDGPVVGLVLSINIIDSEAAGTVTIEGTFGALDAVGVGGPGAATTGLVVVPGTDPAVLVNQPGGDLVVDLVATFVRSGPSAQGRFVATQPTRIGHLATATDGRQAEVAVLPALPQGTPPPAAALVLITADVGDDGGRIGIGPSADALDQMLMWGPPTSDYRQRSGTVLVAPGADGRFSLSYDGGSILDVDLLGYVTSDVAPASVDGLFLPTSAIETVDATFSAAVNHVGNPPPGAGYAFVGLSAAPGHDQAPRSGDLARDLTVASGRNVGTVLPVRPGPDGAAAIEVVSRAAVDARLQVFGYFLEVDP